MAEQEQKQQEQKQAVPKKVAKAYPYAVAKGKAITTRKGIKADGQEVTPDMFKGNGRDRLELLVKRGFVVKNG